MLQQAGLWDRGKDPLKQYSGGMKQRINMTAAFFLHRQMLRGEKNRLSFRQREDTGRR